MVKPTSLVRTNMFLSKEERTGLARIGRREKVSAAEVLRRIIDQALGIEPKSVNLAS